MNKDNEELESMIEIQTKKAMPYLEKAFGILNDLLMKETTCTFLLFWGCVTAKHESMYYKLRDAMVESGGVSPTDFDLLKEFFFSVAQGITDKNGKGEWQKKTIEPPIELDELLRRMSDDDMEEI